MREIFDLIFNALIKLHFLLVVRRRNICMYILYYIYKISMQSNTVSNHIAIPIKGAIN